MNYWLKDVITKTVWITECKTQKLHSIDRHELPQKQWTMSITAFCTTAIAAFLRAMCGHNGHTKALEKMGECNWLRVPVHDAFGNRSLQHGMGDSLWSVSEFPSSSAQTAIWRTLRENLVSGGELELGVELRYSRLCVGWRGLTAHCPNKRQAALCALGTRMTHSVSELTFYLPTSLLQFWYVLLRQSLSI